MQSFVRHAGTVAILARANVDTDQIIPKQFLKRVERTGFGSCLFFDWRYRSDGTPDPDFELNRPSAEGASILVSGPNFGCGSSREHAPWALLDYGFRAVLAPSFADIFYGNCCQNGLLPVVLAEEEIAEIQRRAEACGRYALSVDLERSEVTDDAGFIARFRMDAYRRDMLLRGLDEVGRTLEREPLIAAFERRRAQEPGLAS